MKINSQLFEDILSGKLKGTFVLRNGEKILSDALGFLKPFYRLYIDGRSYYYYNNGRYSLASETRADIIDFIQDTNMKENELTIEIPNNKIVNWDESKKQNKIVLKNKQLTYKDICKELFKNSAYYTNTCGKIESGTIDSITDHNNATTYHQLECILAKNMLANVAMYLNDGWKPNIGDHVFYLTCCGDLKNKLHAGEFCFGAGENLIIFKTQNDAMQAIEILGEETVKLALEPLGI